MHRTDPAPARGVLRIFISYRREDSPSYARELYKELSKHFPDSQIFWDIKLEPGVDFVEEIERAVGSCDVLIAVVGPRWLDLADDQGMRRLDDPSDFVRLEIATALERNIRVIPVLVQGALMPSSERLPEAVRKLARRNASELSDKRWDFDVGELISSLQRAPHQRLVPPTGKLAEGEHLPTSSAADSRGETLVPPVLEVTSSPTSGPLPTSQVLASNVAPPAPRVEESGWQPQPVPSPTISSSSSATTTTSSSTEVSTNGWSGMFRGLMQFQLQRSLTGAIGFYLFYFLIGVVLGGLFGGMASPLGIGFGGGLVIGQIVACIYSLVLSFILLQAKGLLHHPGFLLVGLASGFAALALGALLGVVPAAFLSTRPAHAE